MNVLKVFFAATVAIALAGCSTGQSAGSGANPLDGTAMEKEATDGGTGTAKGEFEKVITSPLAKADNCPYIVAGTIEYRKDGNVIAVVDYGKGECDNIATKVADGRTYELKLDAEKKAGDWELKKVITKPVVKADGCEYIVEGTIKYFKGDQMVALVDYGDGECDDVGTKTVDGKTYEFKLDE